jgi:hypothetical protein
MSYLDKVFEADISDEYRWERIRIYRNSLLTASDWRMLEDAPWDKSAWAAYRQSLRDLPTTVTDPSKIVFPNEPA